MRKRFYLGQVVHVDTNHVEYGHIDADAVIEQIYPKRLWVKIKSLGCKTYVPSDDATAKVLDYDYYIAAAEEIVANSNGLWACVNRSILEALKLGKQDNISLQDVARRIRKQAGRGSKDVPVCMMNYRCAAKQIVKGESLRLI